MAIKLEGKSGESEIIDTIVFCVLQVIVLTHAYGKRRGIRYLCDGILKVLLISPKGIGWIKIRH
jgi:hypothetical protein